MNEPPPSPSTPPVHVVPKGGVEDRSRTRTLIGRHWGKLAFALLIAVIPVCFGVDEVFSNSVPHGVQFWGTDLSRLTRAEAERTIGRLGAAALVRSLTVEVDGRAATLKPGEAGIFTDVTATTARAMNVDRERALPARLGRWIARFTRSAALVPVLEISPSALDVVLEGVEASTVELPRAGGLRLEGDRFVADPPRAGRRIDRALAERTLRAAVEEGVGRVKLVTVAVPAPMSLESVERVVARANDLARASVVLSDAGSRSLALEAAQLRQVFTVEAKRELELGVDAAALERVIAPLRAGLETAPVNARFVIGAKDQVQIVPSEVGSRIDMRRLAESVLQAAAAPDRRGSLPFEVGAEPELSTEGAEKLGIRQLVSTFTTRHPCCERRVENIHRIADLLDGLIVKSGEITSVNAIVGPRTIKNGFVPAPTIEEGEMVDTVGGGISQFATTLFNALFYGGFDILERQPHTYWFTRYPMGHEATLSYPKPDLIFKNDTEHGMLIDTAYTKTTVTVRIFGDNGGRKVQAEVSSRQNVVEPTVEIVGNPEVKPDEEKVREGGMIGWSIWVGRILTFPDGNKKEERRKVTYRPRTRRVEVHPCRVPVGEKGYTGERCPQPEDSAEAEPASTLDP